MGCSGFGALQLITVRHTNAAIVESKNFLNFKSNSRCLLPSLGQELKTPDPPAFSRGRYRVTFKNQHPVPFREGLDVGDWRWTGLVSWKPTVAGQCRTLTDFPL